MSKLRSVSTSFWSDPFVEELSPDEKLLFLYLITNEKTNMLGIYESSLRKISFETGLPFESVSKALERFESLRKVKYSENYVFVLNYMKHQKYNPNMKKSAMAVYAGLPQHVKIEGFVQDLSNPLKAFESLLNHLLMVRKIEVEVEDEIEVETKLEIELESKSTSQMPSERLFPDNTLELFKSHTWIENVEKITKLSNSSVNDYLKKFQSEIYKQDGMCREIGDLKKYFSNWLNKKLEIKTKENARNTGRIDPEQGKKSLQFSD